MASPKSIPSKISGTAGATTISKHVNFLYITALLTNDDITIDGSTIVGPGPVALSSPIICKTFTTTANFQVTYYEA